MITVGRGRLQSSSLGTRAFNAIVHSCTYASCGLAIVSRRERKGWRRINRRTGGTTEKRRYSIMARNGCVKYPADGSRD